MSYFFALVPILLAPVLAWLISLIIAVITLLAGLLGIKLKARGSSRVQEFLLHPKILLSLSVISSVLTIYFYFNQPAKIDPQDVLTGHVDVTGFTPVEIKLNPVALSGAGVEIDEQLGKQDDSALRVRPKLLWQQCSDNFFRTPTITGDHLWVAGDTASIYSLDTDTGEIELEFNRNGVTGESQPMLQINSGISGFGNLIFVGEGGHENLDMPMTCYEIGKEKAVQLKWTFKTKGHTEGMPLVYQDTLYFGVGGDGLYALDVQTGELKWFIDESEIGHIDASPLLVDGVLYVASGYTSGFAKKYPNKTAHAAAVDIKSGNILWKIPVVASWSAPAYSRKLDSIIFPVGQIAKYINLQPSQPVSMERGLLIVDRAGQVKRMVKTNWSVVATPTVHGDWIYFSQADLYFQRDWYDNSGWTDLMNQSEVSRILQNDIEHAQVEMVYRNEQLFASPPVFYGGIMIQALVEGSLVAVDLESKSELWSLIYDFGSRELPCARPLIVQDKIYLASRRFKFNSLDSSVFCFGK